MKITSPILTIAALATTASATINKDRKKPNKKHQSIFHKPNGTPKNGAESLLDNVKAHRRQRRTERDNNPMPKMEKTTKVKRDDIVKRGLERHTILKKAKDTTLSTGDVEKETGPDQAILSEASAKANEKKATASGLRSTGAEALAETTATTTPAPVAAPTVQEVMQKRRQDRSAEMKERMATYAASASSNDRATSFERTKDRRTTTSAVTPRNASGKRERRMSSTSTPGSGQIRAPNPRPGRRTVSTTADKNKRDLRPNDSVGKPSPPNKRDLKKSKKSSYSSKSGSGSGSGSEYDCQVRMTNLTKEQWFSDIFWMVHSDNIRIPLWAYGFPAFDDLARLAQDGDADELIDFYEDNDDGVLDVDAQRGPIQEGESVFFGIPKSGKYDRLTLATSFIFSNDGFVSIRGEDIYDGATFYLWGIDAGVEANTQLCWTVQAGSSDFPPNSECSTIDEDIADENDNSFPGEGFVHVHSGIHDLDDRRAIQDFLSFTCDDLDVDSFVEYFSELGFDDDQLLFDDDRGRNERDDESFLDFVEDNDDLFADFIIFQLAVDAGGFDDFCDELDDIADFLFNTFETLEPQVFDFRTPMMKVELFC